MWRTPSTSGLPHGTSAAWVLSAPAPAGTLTVDVATSGTVKGPFMVEATGKTPRIRYTPIACAIGSGAGPARAFTAGRTASYSAATHEWSELTSVPGAGTVSFVQVFTASGAPLITSGAPPVQLIDRGEVTVGKAGQVALSLRPTAAAAAALHRSGSLKIYLSISFKPSGAVPATTVVTLLLRRP